MEFVPLPLVRYRNGILYEEIEAGARFRLTYEIFISADLYRASTLIIDMCRVVCDV